MKNFNVRSLTLLWGNVLLQVFDGLLTTLCLDHGLHESNRLLRLVASAFPSEGAIYFSVWVGKLVAIAALVWWWNVLSRRAAAHRHQNALYACMAIVMFVIVARNVYIFNS